MPNFEMPKKSDESDELKDQSLEGQADKPKTRFPLFELVTGKELFLGTKVKVLRTSGEMDDGWEVGALPDNLGKCTVQKVIDGKLKVKTIFINDLMEWNSQKNQVAEKE